MSERSNFITDIIDADIANGLPASQIATRFPPEPNGFLHIGHAKSICLNFGLALQYGGRCHLRFDDTNPAKEDIAYVESIQNDVRWLGFDWGDHLHFASDYFERMFEIANGLIDKGLAYVDSQSVDEIREQRAGFGKPGTNSPFRERSIEENRDLFAKMRAGDFEDGSHVLRAKIDMTHPNMVMRDPLLYRIRHITHHRTGDAWCIYPMYDFAHCLEDAIEGITHSICTLEFESARELYDWVLDAVGGWDPLPHQYEFARLKLDYTVMSKRKLLRLVEDGTVSGWDDPRMPTIAGLRRRGVTPEAIRAFAEMVGVAKNNTVVDYGKLEYCIRQDLEARTQRAMCVLNPLKVELRNWPKDFVDKLQVPWRPDGDESREIPFSSTLFIERDDFSEEPPKGWRRLAPGAEVRLMGAYLIRCQEVVRGDDGAVERLICTVDLHSRGGQAADGRKVKGTLHWVSEAHAATVSVRLYDRLFSAANPEADPDVDFVTQLNPNSLKTQPDAKIEPAVATCDPGERFQFVRQGYFIADTNDSKPGAPVFNRVIGLRDSWAKAPKTDGRPTRKKAKKRDDKPSNKRTRAEVRSAARAENPALQSAMDHFVGEWKLSESDADLLSADLDLIAFVKAAVASHGTPAPVASWVVNQLLGVIKDTPVASLLCNGTQFGQLVSLVEAGGVSKSAARNVLGHMVESGRDPAVLIDELGVGRQEDAGLVDEAVDAVFTEHPSEVERFLGGDQKLMGFFMGKTMRALRGRADGQAVRTALLSRLK
ncbi:MAG: glutamine--tRNA ligase/YqeY domain fusion protein [Myxococcales bacterium]|nr:glutamine--tRNA ligase/YqeY domain fusion protein [Myxococcales bacterium]